MLLIVKLGERKKKKRDAASRRSNYMEVQNSTLLSPPFALQPEAELHKTQ